MLHAGGGPHVKVFSGVNGFGNPILSGIGRLFEQLEKSKLTNNVAIFFTSSSAPEKFADTNLNFLLPKDNFRGTNNPTPPRLPMLVRFLAQVATNRVSKLKWTAADIAPTVLEMAYVKPMTNFTGISVLPVLQGKQGTNLIDAPIFRSFDPHGQ